LDGGEAGGGKRFSLGLRMGIRSFTLRDVVWLTLNDISINLTYLQLDLLTSVCLSPSPSLFPTLSLFRSLSLCDVITNVALSTFQLCAIYVGQPPAVFC